MNRIYRICILLFSLMLYFAEISNAQNAEKKFNFSGEIRMRNEIDNRDFNNDTDQFLYSLLRTHINFESQLSEKVTVFAQLQDSRNFGSEDTTGAASTLKSINNVDLHLGYVQINELFWNWLNVKFGRMNLAYGSQRLMSENNWNNVGRAFDGSVITLNFKLAQMDLIIVKTYESNRPPDTTDGDKFLYGLWTKVNMLKAHQLNLYVLTDGDQQKNSDDDWKMLRTTAGAYFKGKYNNFNLETEFNYQTGKMNYTTSIAAYYFATALGYSFNHTMKPQLTIGYDYISGDKSDTEKYECFDTLYPSRHRFFGYMDYFKEMPKHTKNSGINDIIFKTSLCPMEKTILNGDLHVFNLSHSVIVNGHEEKYVGTEFDLTLKYNYTKAINFQLGAAVFTPGEVFKDWKGEDMSWWGFLQTTVSF